MSYWYQWFRENASISFCLLLRKGSFGESWPCCFESSACLSPAHVWRWLIKSLHFCPHLVNKAPQKLLLNTEIDSYQQCFCRIISHLKPVLLYLWSQELCQRWQGGVVNECSVSATCTWKLQENDTKLPSKHHSGQWLWKWKYKCRYSW